MLEKLVSSFKKKLSYLLHENKSQIDKRIKKYKKREKRGKRLYKNKIKICDCFVKFLR